MGGATREKMHSKALDRIRSMCENANVSIGDPFPATRYHTDDTKKKLKRYLSKTGEVDLSKEARTYAKWVHIRKGKISGPVAEKLKRDHAVEFAEFERQERMIKK